jgi:hypothetical protein
VSAKGFTPVVVDNATWEGMTTAAFASYRAIIIGDPTCGNYDDTSHLTAALSNPTTWGAAVNGNVLIIGTDPVFHSFGALTSGPGQLVSHGVDFALAQDGKTGAYIDLSCAYGEVPPNTPVTLLDGIRSGGFSVDGGPSTVCFNEAHIVATHPALTGLTDADLSNWSCSVHEAFDTWPPDYTVLAIAKNFGSTFTASDGTVGEPYILASGSGLHSYPLSLSPSTQTVGTGLSASVTAQLLDTATGLPATGQTISFRVAAGPNAGTSGSCVPSSCATDANGHVVWRYTGSNVGTDTVQSWLDQNGDHVPSPGEPQTSAGVTWTAPSLSLLNKMQVQPCGRHGCATAMITARLLGVDGSPIANQLVTLNLAPAGSTKRGAFPPQPPAAQRTDANGLASFRFTASFPQAVTVHATASDPATGRALTSNNADVAFSPPATSLSPIGALAYSRNGNCSGSVVQSSSGLVVVTAAHCVIDAEAEGPGHWVFGPSYDFASSYAPYGVWTVSAYVFDRNNFPAHEAYDYAFFVIEPDDYGRTIQQIAGGFGPDFSANPGRGFTQYAYPAAAGPGGPAGLITCHPEHGSTAFEASPDSNGAATYNLSCNNSSSFIGSSSGGPLVGDGHTVAGVLQGPKPPGLFFSGVVGAFLSPAALPLFNAANNAALSSR